MSTRRGGDDDDDDDEHSPIDWPIIEAFAVFTHHLMQTYALVLNAQ